MLEQIGKTLSQLEVGAVDIVSRLAPWASPLPTAYLTMRATVEHLAWPQTMGIIAGGIIEALGLASVSTALQLRDYNRTKRKSDPSAPVGLAVLCAGIYFGSIVALTVLLDTMPQLAVYAPLAFPILSLAGVTTLALRGDHRRRLAAIAQGKEERKLSRASKLDSVKTVSKLDSANMAKLDKRNRRLDALAAYYAENPGGSVSMAAKAIDVSRQTVYTYLDELEAAGRVDRSNGTIKVVR